MTERCEGMSDVGACARCGIHERAKCGPPDHLGHLDHALVTVPLFFFSCLQIA